MSTTKNETTGTAAAAFEDEDLIPQCIEVIKLEQKARVSLLQRRLRLGYTRTVRIMEELEKRGVVGPAKSMGEPRDILIELDDKADNRKQKAEMENIGGRNERAGEPPALQYSHADSAQQQVLAAREAALKEVTENFRANQVDWKKRSELDGEMGALDVEIINRMVRSGIRLNECAGENHQQLTFNDSGLLFFKTWLTPSLPPDFSPDVAKACVHLARTIPEGVKTPVEARQYMNYVQLYFGGELNKRGPERLHATVNPLNEIVDGFKKVAADLKSAQAKRPLAEWDRSALETALRAAKPMVDFYEEAGQALKAKGC